ncbi:histidine kinase [Yinghuangia sp. YIM S09857]|uniref:sensor histidine kinase n=1 Tax=Yinghuangia sp. YIM S09857 TaxID=3436929 RepID=UPI003F532A9C
MAPPTTVPVDRNLLIPGWIWRCPVYLAAGVVVGLPVLGLFAVITAPWIAAAIALGERDLGRAAVLLVAGLPAVALAPLAAAPVAALERRRLRVVRMSPTPSPQTRGARDASLPARGKARLREHYAGSRVGSEVGCAILVAVVGPALGTLAMVWAVVSALLVLAPVLVAITTGPVALLIGHAETVPDTLPYCLAGVASVLVGAYALSVLALAHARVTRTLLCRGHQHLAARLVEVTRSRSRLADAFAAERRRIERDLHDGAQQQLLGLSLQLGLARHDLPPDTPAGQAVARAHDQAKELMVALRELIRGIHPQVLTERGLAAALHELAECCPLPVGTDIDLPERPPQAVETAAYFAAAEALANTLKHSGADRADIAARLTDGLLTVDIRDNGCGGARCEGTGLTGIADRVGVTDGTLRLSSPPGGPTLVRVEIPCSLPATITRTPPPPATTTPKPR